MSDVSLDVFPILKVDLIPMALLLQLSALSLFIFNHNVLQCLTIVDVSLTCCCVEVYRFSSIQLSSVDGVSARIQTAVLQSLVVVSFRW